MQDENAKKYVYVDGVRHDRADLFFAYRLKRAYEEFYTVYEYGLEWEKPIAEKCFNVVTELCKSIKLDLTTGAFSLGGNIEQARAAYIELTEKLSKDIISHYEQDGTSIKADIIAKKDRIDLKELASYVFGLEKARESLSQEQKAEDEADARFYLENMDEYTTAAGFDFMRVKDIYNFFTLVDHVLTFQAIMTSYRLSKASTEEAPTKTIMDFPESEFTEAFKEMLPGILAKLQEEQKAAAENKELEKQALPVINDFLAKKIQYTHTKIDRHLFNLLEEAEDGQYNFAVDVSNINDKRKGVEVFINYMLDFSEIEESGLKLTKTINKYDKLVYTAIGSLYTEGQQFVTYPQIYDAMGGSGRPNKTDRSKIEQSIEKMSKTRLTLTNTSENQRYSNYELQEIKDNLLHCRTAKGRYKGQQCDIVEIITEPVLLTFAKKRKQVKTIPKALLQSPGSMSQVNLAIKDYLLEAIIWIKNGYRDSNRILLETIWQETGITRKDYQSDKLQLVKDILKHHTKEKYIKGYLYTGDGFFINPTERQIAEHKGCELFTGKEA